MQYLKSLHVLRGAVTSVSSRHMKYVEGKKKKQTLFFLFLHVPVNLLQRDFSGLSIQRGQKLSGFVIHPEIALCCSHFELQVQAG